MTYNFKRVFVFFFFSLLVCVGFAQKVKTVEATYRYIVPPTVPIADAINHAIEQARLQAIANKFGTTVAQTNLTQIKTKNGESNMEFNSLNESLVRGIWIEDIKREIEKNYDEKTDIMTITCKIKGKARERIASSIMLEAKVLRNEPDKRFESNEFKDGDQLFLEFKSPADGYIAVYLVDTKKEATCLLPYPTDTDGKMEVVHGQEYIFFSKAHDPNASKQDDFIRRPSKVTSVRLYNDLDNHEINQIYIIFSTNPFTKAVDTMENGVGHLSEDELNNWLSHTSGQDPEMIIEKKVIFVNK